MCRKRRKTDNASNELEEVKTNNSTKIKEKRRSNFPKAMTIVISMCMVIVVLIQGFSMAYIVHEYLIMGVDNVTITKACQEIFAGNFITLGISIVAMAVSVWIGLNINVAIEKGELSERIEDLAKAHEEYKEKQDNNLQEYKKRQTEIEDSYKEDYARNWSMLQKQYVDNVKKEWIGKIQSLATKYLLSDYLGEVLKTVDFGDNIELISALLQYENDYIVMTQLYENENRRECIARAVEFLKRDFCKGIEINELQLYLDIRKSDATFYKCACEVREGIKEQYIIGELEQSLVVYHKLEKGGDIAQYSRTMEVYAYICNTLGYSYDLMNQVNPTMERKKVAIAYMEKAVVAMKEIKGNVRGRYYRNLGLAYQRAERWDDARVEYERALKDNPKDNKSYVTIAGIVLDNIERALGIKNRTKPLYVMDEEFIPFIEDIKYAIELCEESICLEHSFEDPYYKIAQAYTYLFLVEGKKKTYISEAKKYLHKLQIRGFERAGYKFTLRNMYEALSDIRKAAEINNTIIGTPYNDVERLKGLYEELMQKQEEMEEEDKGEEE